jgi:hypothetical protein
MKLGVFITSVYNFCGTLACDIPNFNNLLGTHLNFSNPTPHDDGHVSFVSFLPEIPSKHSGQHLSSRTLPESSGYTFIFMWINLQIRIEGGGGQAPGVWRLADPVCICAVLLSPPLHSPQRPTLTPELSSFLALVDHLWIVDQWIYLLFIQGCTYTTFEQYHVCVISFLLQSH